MQPVDVLGRIDQLEDRELVDVVRQRQLDDVAGAARIGVELREVRLELGLAHVGRQIDPDRLDADLDRVTMLARDVPSAARVVTDEYRPQTGCHTGVAQARDTLPQLAFDRRRRRLAVEYPGRHGATVCHGPRGPSPSGAPCLGSGPKPGHRAPLDGWTEACCASRVVDEATSSTDPRCSGGSATVAVQASRHGVRASAAPWRADARLRL